ncbi:Short-chain dehydrogenase/reductase family protein [Mycena sanguinolenta]|uniref:Short-chain dehydrogenase/reductase family protein n=1 Tax=Mycena sanguinolenta TaxID=230812 RepID=A0A8H6XKV0_9AGAR|nr:Short-chain dehydrogenase/reductase family protein [Mycena sanguinolenta]
MPWLAYRILFSPGFRIHTTYIFLAATLCTLVFSAFGLYKGLVTLDVGIAASAASSIILHQLLIAFIGRKLYAAVDMVLTLSEFGVLMFVSYNTYMNEDAISFLSITFLGIQLLALLLLILFRASTMWASSERFYKQPFEFFGGCVVGDAQAGKHFLYAIFGRSMWRPLVRGEALLIKMLRTIVLLSLLMIGPAYLVDIAVIRPVYNSKTVTQTVLGSLSSYVPTPVNITLVCIHRLRSSQLNFPEVFAASSQMDKSAITVATPARSPTTTCPVNDLSGVMSPSFVAFIAECDGTWATDFAGGLEISINFNGTSTIAYIYVGEGDMTKTLPLIEPIVLVPGSHIFVSLALTMRTFLSNSPLDFLSRSRPQPVAMNKISTVQPDPSPSSSGLITATLRLVRVYQGLAALTYPDSTLVELRNELRDPSVLGGLSSAGGLWTFANGAFVFLFGADLLYFFLGHRPLSALGLLHIFQKRTIKRKWHEDFPALRTEGGLPGSETAGIVAFLRERLVDLGDSDPDKDELLPEKRPNDPEAQRV